MTRNRPRTSQHRCSRCASATPGAALTSMGTALVLLFLLALGAIPGALLPQRSLNEGKVEQYIADHPTHRAVAGPAAGSSTCSPASGSPPIYVLLFISLVGCLTAADASSTSAACAPRPVPAPRNLGSAAQAPHRRGRRTTRDAVATARWPARLRGWRPRSARAPTASVVEISAEKGYLREFGNLVFHFSLLGLLVAVAVGKLFGYEGNVIVIADGGPGFCSASPAAFDSFRAGNTVDGTSLNPICLRVNDFEAHYLPTGQATSFAANIDYQAGADLDTRHLAAATAWRSTTRCGSAATGSTCRATATRRRSPSPSPTGRPARRRCSGGPTTRSPCCRRA